VWRPTAITGPHAASSTACASGLCGKAARLEHRSCCRSRSREAAWAPLSIHAQGLLPSVQGSAPSRACASREGWATPTREHGGPWHCQDGASRRAAWPLRREQRNRLLARHRAQQRANAHLGEAEAAAVPQHRAEERDALARLGGGAEALVHLDADARTRGVLAQQRQRTHHVDDGRDGTTVQRSCAVGGWWRLVAGDEWHCRNAKRCCGGGHACRSP
jgi:hypothetical protein